VAPHVAHEVGTAGQQRPLRPIETTNTRQDQFKIDRWTQWARMFDDRWRRTQKAREDFSAGL
jgi:hypothetical protein